MTRTNHAASPARCALAIALLSTSSTIVLADAPAKKPIPDGHAPAGVMVDHMHKAGEFMVGYRYMYARQSGDTLNGTSKADDHDIRHNACLLPGQDPHSHHSHNHCEMKQDSMRMQMHMLDIMYAPTDWLTLMVMPQWMSMDMTMVALEGGHHMHGHGSHGHGTEGFGDTTFGAMVRLSEGPGFSLHTGLMLSAPTGSTDEKNDKGEYTHYMMQLGSGTWDFLPSLTYVGRADRWSWGLQGSGVIRMEDENDEGYRLGNVFQATGWASYRLNDWFSASLRLLHTQQSEIEGHYDGPHGHHSPPDLQGNYGGRFWDLGIGVNMVVPEGTLKGHRLAVEWMEPLRDDVNGYQQERDGSLFVNWSKAF